MKKIISLNEVNSYKKLWDNKKSVLVGGCFDLLHFGHLSFLKKAKGQGDFLIVILESDEFIKKRKNRMPVHNQSQRGELLSALIMVDLVVLIPRIFSDMEYLKLVEKIKPLIIAVSEGDVYLEQKKSQAKIIGSKIVSVSPLIAGFSSKKIINQFEI